MMNADPDFTRVTAKELVDYLQRFITPRRYSKFREVVAGRTRHLTVVLEDIYQPHNASAVLRTCDCFGIQDVHIVENRNTYQVNPDVALGASKWLTLVRYNGGENNTPECLAALRRNGYRIVATTPHKDGFIPSTLPLDQKTALVFGTELEGLTQQVLEFADDSIRIPMVGFTESLNISVSAAIFIQNLTERLKSSDIAWQLKEAEQDEILLKWLMESVGSSEMILRDYLHARTAG